MGCGQSSEWCRTSAQPYTYRTVDLAFGWLVSARVIKGDRLQEALPTLTVETLTVDVEGPVGRITLNRPDRLNAITLQMLEELIAVARWFDDQIGVRVVVVAGEGRAFTGGYDIDGFHALATSGLQRRVELARGGEMAEALESMRAITVARLHGWVVGGGVVIAAACDLRVAAHDTRFKIPEVQLGIPLNWAGIPRLVREIGPALTRELVMTCREFSSDEAVAAGFLNRVVDPSALDAEVDLLVESLLAMPEVPLIATKDQVNAVTRAMSARVGFYMDGDGMGAAMSIPEFEKDFSDYRESLG